MKKPLLVTDFDPNDPSPYASDTGFFSTPEYRQLWYNVITMFHQDHDMKTRGRNVSDNAAALARIIFPMSMRVCEILWDEGFIGHVMKGPECHVNGMPIEARTKTLSTRWEFECAPNNTPKTKGTEIEKEIMDGTAQQIAEEIRQKIRSNDGNWKWFPYIPVMTEAVIDEATFKHVLGFMTRGHFAPDVINQ